MLICTVLDPYYKRCGGSWCFEKKYFFKENVDQMATQIKKNVYELFYRYFICHTILES